MKQENESGGDSTYDEFKANYFICQAIKSALIRSRMIRSLTHDYIS